MSANVRVRRYFRQTHGPESKKMDRYEELGSVHPLPPNMTRDEYEKMRRHWDSVLKETGFKDIENINPRTGQATPTFRASGLTPQKSTDQQIDSYRADKVEYFRMCRAFLAHANFEELFGKNAWLYHTLFTLHVDGLSFRKMAKHFRGSNVPADERRPKASMFWSHWHTERILRVMWSWQRTHPEGLLLPGESE